MTGFRDLLGSRERAAHGSCVKGTDLDDASPSAVPGSMTHSTGLRWRRIMPPAGRAV